MPACSTVSNCVVYLHSKLQQSTWKVKNQKWLGSNWMSMPSLHFFFFNCAVNICAVANFTGTFSVLFQPYSTKRSRSTDISTNTSVADFLRTPTRKQKSRQTCTCWRWKGMDCSGFKLFWARAQCPARTAEYPEPNSKSYRVETISLMDSWVYNITVL